MRLVYLDESGTGDLKNEPITVVAGVIVDADKQWQLVESKLNEIVEKYIRKEDRTGFVFHASDLFHESKNRIPRERYSPEVRLEILDALCAIPGDLELPIVVDWLKRSSRVIDIQENEYGLPQTLELTMSDINTTSHLLLSTMCAVHVDKFVQAEGHPQEVAVLILEDNPQTRKEVKQMHNFGRHRYKRLIDTIHFAEKSEAPLLQLADVCACVLKRRLMGKKGSDRFASKMMPCIVNQIRNGWPEITI